ncbi:hypothetical protein HPB47_024520 [Ixodes persulcatus]|uniref:Uncharacterized protein n=1 Tax=Ixodes persulcatus TaxID=34615 RepID=A0AC60Q626_IXOPE|nr:hypothetical protein HPB47_024520 [Ixodes persulcatus]
MFECNDHPTPSQFLVSVNCLTFAKLAKLPTEGYVTGSALRCQVTHMTVRDESMHLLDLGNLQEAKATLDACGIVSDQPSLTHEGGDSHLVFYVAGHLARKCIRKTNCRKCTEWLLQDSAAAAKEACLMSAVNQGELLYRSAALSPLVMCLENAFTACFSSRELGADSILDMCSFLQACALGSVGCTTHSTTLTNMNIKFLFYFNKVALPCRHKECKSAGERGKEKKTPKDKPCAVKPCIDCFASLHYCIFLIIYERSSICTICKLLEHIIHSRHALFRGP